MEGGGGGGGGAEAHTSSIRVSSGRWSAMDNLRWRLTLNHKLL